MARRFQCTTCPTTYSLKRDLDVHRQTNREFCTQCGRWVCQLPIHVRSTHQQSRRVDNVDDLVQPRSPFMTDCGFQVAYMGKLGEISDYKKVSRYHQIWNRAAGDNFTYRDLTIWLCEIYRSLGSAFKINLGIGFLLFHPVTKVYKYHYVSENSLLFDKSIVVDSPDSLRSFIERVRGLDLATSAYLTKPSSQWVLAGITNFQAWVTLLPGILLGSGPRLPEYLRKLKNIYCLTGVNGKEYNDSLCLFRCIAVHHGQPVRRLERYTRMIGEQFEQRTGLAYWKGVALHDLPRVEIVFKMVINVFSLMEDGTVKIVYQSPLVFNSVDRPMNLNLYETHFSYIRDMRQYGSKFSCPSCQRIFDRKDNLEVHVKICEQGGTRQVFVGGRLNSGQFETIWEKLARIGIHCEGKYDFFCVYDFESLQVPTKDRYRGLDTHYIHIPATVSTCSNIGGMENPVHFQSDGNTQKLIDSMVCQLLEYQKEASRLMRRKYSSVLTELAERMEREEEEEGEMFSHLKWLYGSFAKYIDTLPVVGYNSGRYDIPLVRRFLPLALEKFDSLPTFVIKKGRSYMSLCTKRLHFLDLTNFLGAGTSLKDFYKAYKVTQGKGLFPYSWFSSLDKLTAPGFPTRDPEFRKALDTNNQEAIKRLMPHDPFYDILHLSTISNLEFDECLSEYKRLKMTNFGDYVKLYNNLDVVGMVEGVDKMATIYQDHSLCMLKDAVSLPRLSQKIIFRSLEKDDYFVSFGKQHKYIFQELREKIVGGPSIIFTRYAEANVTRIRNGPEFCKTVEGWDANSLYLWGTGQKQCTGPYTLLEKKYKFKKHCKKEEGFLKYSQKAINWLNFLQEERGFYIRTAENHCLGEKRILNMHVDGFAEPNKVFEFLGCYFHGHDCTKKNKDIDKWEKTMERIEKLRSLGYDVEFITECEWKSAAKVTEPKYPPATFQELVVEISNDEVFGIVCCDLHVPPHLIEKYSPFPPIFKNTSISLDVIGKHMQRYCTMIGRDKGVDRSLISSMFGSGLVMLTPLFKKYIEMGLICTDIKFLLEYNPQPVFQWFTDKVANDRRYADLDPAKQIIGETSKLAGNSCYGYCCIDKSKHNTVRFCKEQDIARHVNDPNFVSLEELDGGLFEVVKKKSRIVQDTPLQVAIGVYSYAKMKLLEFWLFLDEHLDRNLWCLIECDTDSLYFALARDSLDECVRPEMKDSWEKSRDSVLCSQSEKLRPDGMTEKQWSKRAPGLFKLEYKGKGMIALNSKVYYAWADDDFKKSAKGMQERNENLVEKNFKEALFQQRPHYVQNSGFVVDGTTTLTYTQMKRGLSYFYCKRVVLEDGISTTHLDI